MYSLVCATRATPSGQTPVSRILHPLSLSLFSSFHLFLFFSLSPSFEQRETRNPPLPLPAVGRYRTIAMDLTNRSLIKPNRFRFRQFRAGINSVGYATRFARPRYLAGMWERWGGGAERELNTCVTCLYATRCGKVDGARFTDVACKFMGF